MAFFFRSSLMIHACLFSAGTPKTGEVKRKHLFKTTCHLHFSCEDVCVRNHIHQKRAAKILFSASINLIQKTAGVDMSESTEALSTILAYKGDEVSEKEGWNPPRPHPPQQTVKNQKLSALIG